MGNTFYKQIKNEEALNNQCPICLLDFTNKNDSITLACSHRIHIDCGKHLCKDYLISENKINCPFCRNNIKTCEINLFLKNKLHDIEIDDPKDWSRKDIIELDDIYNGKYKLKKLNVSNYPNLLENKFSEDEDKKIFFIPTIKKNNIDVPFYLKIKTCSRFNIDNHELSNSNLKFQLYMNLRLNNHEKYNYYLEKLEQLFTKQQDSNKLNYFSFDKDIYNCNKHVPKLRTCIENTEQVKIFDIYDGEIHDEFKLKNSYCDIIVKPIIYIQDNNLFYINKLISVLYY